MRGQVYIIPEGNCVGAFAAVVGLEVQLISESRLSRVRKRRISGTRAGGRVSLALEKRVENMMHQICKSGLPAQSVEVLTPVSLGANRDAHFLRRVWVLRACWF